MDISIIIPTFNRERVLINTIESVLTECKKTKYKHEIVVVDQTLNHERDTVIFLDEMSSQGYIKVIKEDKPSLPRARNIGIKNSKGEIILFIDDDVELEDNFIDEHINQYKNHSIGGVVGRVTICNESKNNIVLNNSSKLKKNIKKVFFKLYTKNASVITKRGIVLADFEGKTNKYADTVIGCNMSFRRVAIEEAGLFDENYIGNAIREETDLCIRIKKHNYKIKYNPNAHLYHIMFNYGGCRNEKNDAYWDTYFQNQCYFLIKNFKMNKFNLKINLILDIITCKFKQNISAVKIINNKYDKVISILKE